MRTRDDISTEYTVLINLRRAGQEISNLDGDNVEIHTRACTERQTG